ncbi:hypothetical protein VNO77_17073 [Canavalia gladiata]|uniref:DET1- and DDB1-associated protein 1 domain-containing protein n=1 Tax=Canavalia gladiata TaxID=3824 RepID=A0AAN9QGA0_CANGL
MLALSHVPERSQISHAENLTRSSATNIIILQVGMKDCSGLYNSQHSMESVLGNWPSYDPHNFSQLRPSDPSSSSKMTPATYHPTHNRTLPPPDQVISTEAKNILLRHIYQHAEEKLKPKRAAPGNLLPEHGCKQPRIST